MIKLNYLVAFTFSIVLLNADFTYAQKDEGSFKLPKSSKTESDIISFGLGLGLDYGGIGANLTIYPVRNLGVFGGFGFNPVGFGYNGGIKARLLNNKKYSATPFLVGMYGYYAALKVKGIGSRLSKQFYGYTAGFGVETPLKPNRVGYWSFAILIPFRGSQVDDYVAKNKIALETQLLPFGISLGYKFAMRK